jgi:hypothetical protein
MAVFRPRETACRAALWHDKDGRPWLVILDFTMIAGRLQCVGMEMRSFLRDEVDISEDDDPEDFPATYPVYWEGEPGTIFPEVPADRGFALLPPGSGVLGRKVDAKDLLAMSRPGPLQATVLRQLPLADVCTRMRRQGGSWADGFPPMTVFESGTLDDWLEERKAAWAPKTRRGGRVAKYSHSDLEQVAAIYSEAYESGSNSPTKDVAEQLAITRNQAAKLVMKCRKSGLLGPVPWATAGGTLGESRTYDQQRQRSSRRRSSEDEGGSDDDTP